MVIFRISDRFTINEHTNVRSLDPILSDAYDDPLYSGLKFTYKMLCLCSASTTMTIRLRPH